MREHRHGNDEEEEDNWTEGTRPRTAWYTATNPAKRTASRDERRVDGADARVI